MIPLNSLAINHIAQNIENIKSCYQYAYTTRFIAIPKIFTGMIHRHTSEDCLRTGQMLADNNKST